MPLLTLAQFDENFDDGDLVDPWNWEGETDQFRINNDGQLQLDASGPGEAGIFLPTEIPDSPVWSMYWLMDFAPSSANYLRIYLQLDTTELSIANGYFIEVGENGSDDRISLFRMEAGEEVLLGSLTEGAQSNEPAEAYFSAHRTPGGQWTLQANYEGAPFPQDETIIDESSPLVIANGYFGLYCVFTTQRVDRFYFDDISLSAWLPDTHAPQWTDFNITDNRHITVSFDEVIASAEADSIALEPGIGSASDAVIPSAQPTNIELSFTEPMIPGTTYTLILNGIADASGNAVQDDSIIFDYIVPVEPAPYELLIHEIMFEPQEGHVLPDAEYIELYNPTSQHLKMESFRLADEASETIIPDHEIPPMSYLILTDEDQADLFEIYGAVLGIPSMPALNNSGDIVQLKNAIGDIVHEHRFDEESYGNASKAGEGWSIEMINPLDPCATSVNWTASVDNKQGSPGVINSVTDTTVPLQALVLEHIFPLNSNEIKLQWSKGLDPQTAAAPAHFSIEPGLNIISASLTDDRKSVILAIEPGLESGQQYHLTVKQSITDCAGQSPVQQITETFGIPKQPLAGEVVLNEILFDPVVGGDPFIELYNNAEHFLDYSQLFITYDDGDEIENFRFPLAFSAEPHSSIVLTPSTTDISNRYIVPHPEWLFKTNMSSLNQSGGTFRIFLDSNGVLKLLDSAQYASSYHGPFLDETEGVSLERLRPEEDGFSPDNWYSAAETAGYATPTGTNSQSVPTGKSGEDNFKLLSKTFSPDGDGFEDQLILEYALDRSGYKATIDIYDRNGYLVRHWIRNRSLGREGFLRWNGANDEGEKAQMGMYILRIELWHPEGDRKLSKKVCVLASKFD